MSGLGGNVCFAVIKIQGLGFDHNFCFTFLYPVAFFPKNHWTVFVVIVVISAAARKETVVQVRQEVAGRCMTAGRGVKGFHFPHMRRKTEVRQLDFLVIRPQQNSIIIALYIENATLSEILYIFDAVV